jgi:hypothetical protein
MAILSQRDDRIMGANLKKAKQEANAGVDLLSRRDPAVFFPSLTGLPIAPSFIDVAARQISSKELQPRFAKSLV